MNKNLNFFISCKGTKFFIIQKEQTRKFNLVLTGKTSLGSKKAVSYHKTVFLYMYAEVSHYVARDNDKMI